MAKLDEPLTLATRNPHKLAEVGRILSSWGIAVKPVPENVQLPPEDGDSFAANALPKARAAARAVEGPAIADDSGIEATELAGAPGVRSARFAGSGATDEENLQKLVREVSAGSELRYVCALAFVDPTTRTERVFCGECAGHLAGEARGSGGFGYDPVFVPDEDADGRTMAELSEREKDQISHRGRALRRFAEWLRG